MASKIQVQVTINDKVYHVNFINCKLTSSIVSMMPLTLNFTRALEREYYCQLPQKAGPVDLKTTFDAHKNSLYYFEAWNAMSMFYNDANTSPDEIYNIGEYEEDISECLKEQGDKLTIKFEKA